MPSTTDITTQRLKRMWSMKRDISRKLPRVWVWAYPKFQQQPKSVARMNAPKMPCNSLRLNGLEVIITIGERRNGSLPSISSPAATQSVVCTRPMA